MENSVQLHGALEIAAELRTSIWEHHFRKAEIACPFLLEGESYLVGVVFGQHRRYLKVGSMIHDIQYWTVSSPILMNKVSSATSRFNW